MPRARDAADRLALATREYLGRTLLKDARATIATAAQLAADAERLDMRRLAARFARAAGGAPPAVLDLAVLHQL